MKVSSRRKDKFIVGEHIHFISLRLVLYLTAAFIRFLSVSHPLAYERMQFVRRRVCASTYTHKYRRSRNGDRSLNGKTSRVPVLNRIRPGNYTVRYYICNSNRETYFYIRSSKPMNVFHLGVRVFGCVVVNFDFPLHREALFEVS